MDSQISLDPLFQEALRETLVFLPELGMGYYPVTQTPYDKNYFEKYIGYSKTDMGIHLTNARIEFVRKFYKGPLVDIGIGCGHFLDNRRKLGFETYGFDINPYGVKWLEERNIFKDPVKEKIKAASFWDSLEHIHDPMSILSNVTEWVFVSVPIFKGADHILKSKHFRKDEHCWYWTHEGFENWMFLNGFRLIDSSLFETYLGREDIHTFAFKRK